MAGPVEVTRDGAVAWCALNRPPLNLFDPDLIAALAAAFAELTADPALRAIVLTGRGRAFTAGMDVRVLGALDGPGARELITSLHQAIEAVHHAPVPVVAAVNGPALGAGFELALACDLRVAAAGATLGLPEVRVGVPSVIEAALLPGLVGRGRAAELLLTGEAIDARQALDWGLVNRVAEPAGLAAAVEELVGRLLAAAPGALRLQKQLMLTWRYTDLGPAIRAGIEAFVAAYATAEPAEGAAAFLGRRRPAFDARPPRP